MLAVTPAEAAGRARLQLGAWTLPGRPRGGIERGARQHRHQRQGAADTSHRNDLQDINLITHESAREVHALRPFSSDLPSSGAGVTNGWVRDATGGRMEPGLAVDG